MMIHEPARRQGRTAFWSGETAAIVRAMKATGNLPGMVALWKADIEEWAYTPPMHADKAAVVAWLPHWQVRPFYTAGELAPLWPAFAIAIGHTRSWPAVQKSARRLEFELDFAGLPHFEAHGKRYYIVERLHYWKNATQEERENALSE